MDCMHSWCMLSCCMASAAGTTCPITCAYAMHHAGSIKLCVSDAQGKTLTNSIKQIFTDFQSAAEKFQKLNYDAMNLDATQFADDFSIFCGVIRELERRLGAVVAQVCCRPLPHYSAAACIDLLFADNMWRPCNTSCVCGALPMTHFTFRL